MSFYLDHYCHTMLGYEEKKHGSLWDFIVLELEGGEELSDWIIGNVYIGNRYKKLEKKEG